MKSQVKNIRISPKKANLIAGMMRDMKAEEALNFLKFTPKKACGFLYKALHSAVANAENNHQQKKENLTIDQVIVQKGPVLKRNIPSSRGRALPIHKPTSHIYIVLKNI